MQLEAKPDFDVAYFGDCQVAKDQEAARDGAERGHAAHPLATRERPEARPFAHRAAGGLKTRFVLAGLAVSFAAGRIGRRTNSPPQFGQRPDK